MCSMADFFSLYSINLKPYYHRQASVSHANFGLLLQIEVEENFRNIIDNIDNKNYDNDDKNSSNKRNDNSNINSNCKIIEHWKIA